MISKYEAIKVENDSIHRMLQSARETVPPATNAALGISITMDELYTAL
jgi:hypothetical protein